MNSPVGGTPSLTWPSLCSLYTACGLQVKSVDGYQGREKDMIVFSAVRSNPEGQVSWNGGLNFSFLKALGDAM